MYLHVLRPLIKPYSGVLDTVFDGLASFGDLLVLIASIPVNYVLGFYRRWTSALDPPQADPQTWHQDAPRAGPRPSAHRAFASESNGDARPAPTRDVSTGSVRQTRSTFVRGDSSTPTQQQIWHPPPSAYADEVALNPHSGLPTPPIERQPLPPFNGSESPIVAPKPVRAGNAARFSGIAEEEDANHPKARQDFRKSLLLPREPRNPGSAGDLSDEHHTKGVQQTQQKPKPIHLPQVDINNGNDSENEMNVDEDDEDAQMQDQDGSEYDSSMDEDVFNTTLRTPAKRRRYRTEDDSEYDEDDYLDDLMLTPPPMKLAFSIDSVATRSTTLSTTDAGSSLRTRTSSPVSTAPSSILDAPSPTKKRRVPQRYAADDAKFSLAVPPRKAASVRASAKSQSTIGRTRGKAMQDKDASEGAVADDAPDGEDEAASDASDDAQRTIGRAAGARPKPQRGDSQGTIRAPATRGKAATATRTRAAATRPPSARVAAAAKKPAPAKKASAGALSVASASDRKGTIKGQKTTNAK